GDDRIVEEKLEKVAEPEEEERVPGEPALHLEVLLHHRGQFLGLRHRRHSKGSGCIIQCWSDAGRRAPWAALPPCLPRQTRRPSRSPTGTSGARAGRRGS